MVLRTDTSSKSAITTAAPAGFKCGGRGPFCECQPEILGFLLKLLVLQTQVRDCLVASLDGLTGIRLHRLRFSEVYFLIVHLFAYGRYDAMGRPGLCPASAARGCTGANG